MAHPTKSDRLARQSVAIMMAAVETYNRIDFKYREETFAILAVNAWELLLKAHLLARSGNKLRSLFVYEKRRNKSGIEGKKTRVKKNRSDNPTVIGLSEVLKRLQADSSSRLEAAVVENLEVLVEIRDNAVHFVNRPPEMSKAILEVGSSCVANFLRFAQAEFDGDLSKYNLHLLPLGFIASGTADAIVATQEEARLLKWISSVVAHDESRTGSSFFVAMRLKVELNRTQTGGQLRYVQSKAVGSTPVVMTEEDIRAQYPWTYLELTQRLRQRYADFKVNAKYHELRKPLESDPRFAYRRSLDPSKPYGLGKTFFKTSILDRFDGHYSLKR